MRDESRRPKPVNITVMGSGSWGTALAKVAANKGHSVVLWCRDEKQAELISKSGKNDRYLPDVDLPPNITPTSDLVSAMKHSNMWIMAVPTQASRSLLSKLRSIENDMDGISICNVAKGIEINTLKRVSQIVQELTPKCKYTVLSGPSHAEEVVKGLPTAVVVASDHQEETSLWQDILTGETFRIYSSEDVCGVETGGALKNVIAIASGLAHRMEMGDNATAALVSRGLAEIMRLAVAMGAHPITLAGLAGIGDLMVTAYSRHSRNFRLGMALGEGLSLEEAIETLGQVAEGAYTVKAAVELGKKLKVELPISESVYQVLYEGLSPKEAIRELMSRDPKPEYPPHIFQE